MAALTAAAQSASAATPAPGGSVPVPEGSTSLHYAPMPDDLEIPTFLRRQMD